MCQCGALSRKVPGWPHTLLELVVKAKEKEPEKEARRRQIGSAGPGNEEAATEERAADSDTLKVRLTVLLMHALMSVWQPVLVAIDLGCLGWCALELLEGS